MSDVFMSVLIRRLVKNFFNIKNITYIFDDARLLKFYFLREHFTIFIDIAIRYILLLGTAMQVQGCHLRPGPAQRITYRKVG